MTLEPIKIYELQKISDMYAVTSHTMYGEIRDIDGRKYGIVGKEHILKFIKNTKFTNWLLVDIESGMIICQSNTSKCNKESFLFQWQIKYKDEWIEYTKTKGFQDRVKLIRESLL